MSGKLNAYYFENNEGETLQLFEQAGIRLSGKLKSFVEQLSDYLADEYNLSFSQFMSESELECSDIKDMLDDVSNDADPQEFARVALEEYEARRRKRVYTNLMLIDRKLI